MLYFNIGGKRVLYGDSGSASVVGNGNLPGLTFGDVLSLSLQLLNSETVDSDTGFYSDPYTGYASKTVTASAVVDVDYKTEVDSTVSTAIASGTSIDTIDLAYTPAESPVRTHGKIYLGAYAESVYYKNCVLKSTGIYTFTLSNSSYEATPFTPSNAYTSGATAHVRTASLIVVPSSSFTITKATGLFTFTLDGANTILWDKIKNTSSVSGAVLEVQIFVDGVRDRTIQCDFSIDGTMAIGDINISNPSAQDLGVLDSRYVLLTALAKAIVTDPTTGRITGIKLQGPGGELFTQTVQADGSLFLPTTQDAE